MAALAIALIAGPGCGADGEALFSPAEAASLASIAPQLRLDELVAELSLPDARRGEFEERLGALHESMASVHAKVPRSTAGMSRQALESLHEDLQGELKVVHERHHDLMQTLDAAQRAKFMEFVHARMKEHHDALGLEAPDHTRMREMHDAMSSQAPAHHSHDAHGGSSDTHHR